MKAYSTASVTLHSVFIPCDCEKKQAEIEKILFSVIGTSYSMTGLGFTIDMMSQDKLDDLRERIYDL